MTQARSNAPLLSGPLWPVALLASTLALLPAARLAELPILIMALVGCVDLVRLRTRYHQVPGLGLLTALFAAYFIPVVIAALDAVHPERTWISALGMLRFFPVGVFVLVRLDTAGIRRVIDVVAALALLWSIDALFQAAVGVNLLGMPKSPERLNGIFGPTNIKLGHVLAVLSPMVVEALARRGRRWLIPGIAVLSLIILLIGTRSAWIMFALALFASLLISVRRRGGSVPIYLAGTLIFVLISGLTAYQASASFRDRVDRSAHLLGGDAMAMDHALSQRLPIWKTALAMSAAHPINGVGARGFRYAYPAHAAADDPWLTADRSAGAAHAHHIVLEVSTETGLIGLIGLACGIFFAVWAWRRASARQRGGALPFAIAAAVMLFPINTHLAFYSSFWGLVFWWQVILFISALHRPDP